MEKGIGQTSVKKYVTRAYPPLFFINYKGIIKSLSLSYHLESIWLHLAKETLEKQSTIFHE
mgnify:FL=1